MFCMGYFLAFSEILVALNYLTWMTDIFYTLEILIYYTKDQFIVSVAMIKSATFSYLPMA